jgi:hypothetical protein
VGGNFDRLEITRKLVKSIAQKLYVIGFVKDRGCNTVIRRDGKKPDFSQEVGFLAATGCW